MPKAVEVANLETQNAPVIDWQRGRAGPDASSTVVLRPQSLAVLKILNDNIGKIVTREQIMAAVWPDVAVTDDSLVQCITEIRKAIADTDRTIIKTLPKRGYIFEPRSILSGVEPKRKLLSGHRQWGLAAATSVAATAVIVGLTAAAMLLHPTPKPVELPAIAVLPFNNLGSDPKGDKFADMMTEDVITDLSHSKDFAVIARNSTDVYKGKPVDIRTVGHDLNVKYVLEGSVEALPGRVRATAQLISPVTNAHVWSERFEAQGDDVFAVEAEVTNRIATSILGHDAAAADNERSLIRRKPPQTWSAYEAYQAGLEASHHMSPDYIPKSEEMFSRALAIDPNFARAHLGLAWVNLLKVLYGLEQPEIALAKMLAEGKAAESLDPEDGETHAALAQAYSLLHDQSKMIVETGRALTLAPGNADILVMTSPFLLQTGQSDLAVRNINKALSLNPNFPFWYNTTLYTAFFYAGDFAKSYEYAKEAARVAPVNGDFLAMDAAYLGKTEEVTQAKEMLVTTDHNWSAERLLTNFGAFNGAKELERLTTGATKAGLRVCMTKEEIVATPNAIHIAACDEQRTNG